MKVDEVIRPGRLTNAFVLGAEHPAYLLTNIRDGMFDAAACACSRAPPSGAIVIRWSCRTAQSLGARLTRAASGSANDFRDGAVSAVVVIG